MTRIQNAGGQIPGVIKTAVATIIQGSPQEVMRALYLSISIIHEYALLDRRISAGPDPVCTGPSKDMRVCLRCHVRAHKLTDFSFASQAATECESAFHGLSNLAGEMVVACTNQVWFKPLLLQILAYVVGK